MITTARKPPTLDPSPKSHFVHKHALRQFSINSSVPTSSNLFLRRKSTCACGGGCPRCKRQETIQPKLKVGAPNDIYEQEADRVAEQIMRMPASAVQRAPTWSDTTSPSCRDEDEIQTKPIADTITPLVQRQSEPEEEEEEAIPEEAEVEPEEPSPILESVPTRDADELGEEEEEPSQSEPEEEEEQAIPEEDEDPDKEEEEETIQAKRAKGQTPRAASHIEDQIHGLRGGGQPLPGTERAFFEPRFGQDFSGVRVHTGMWAAEAAETAQARAFTLGRDVVFGAGQYSPGTISSRKLLAHELTHVVQQNKVPSKASIRGVIQRQARKPSVRTTAKVCKRVMPSPPVPQIHRVSPWHTFLGPFHFFGSGIHNSDTNKRITNVLRHYRELKSRDDPVTRRVIIAIDRFLRVTLKRSPKKTIPQFMNLIFGPPAKRQKQTAGEVKISLNPKTPKKPAESLIDAWHTIGDMVRKPNTPNPFYTWAATLHERHHQATILKRFKGPLIKKIHEAKKDLLAKNYLRAGIPMSRIVRFKATLQKLMDPQRIFEFIRRSPIAAFEIRWLMSKARRLYNAWQIWINKTKNYAKDDLEAYCVSWTAIRRAMAFIKQVLPASSLKRRGRQKRPTPRRAGPWCEVTTVTKGTFE
jgi:hypothetical protein